MSREQFFDRRKKALGRDTQIAIEIVNNTGETHDLTFLGMEYRHHLKKGISIKNVFDDTLYDDGELLQLSSMIMSAPLMFSGIMFQTSLLYGGFSGKTFSISKKNAMHGGSTLDNFVLHNYMSPATFSGQVLSIHKTFILDMFTELKQTSIKAGERLILILLPTRNDGRIEDLVKGLEATLTKDKKRKFLFIV